MYTDRHTHTHWHILFPVFLKFHITIEPFVPAHILNLEARLLAAREELTHSLPG